ncbi:hypothetical protein [Neorhizobium alkalisoli]|uniref:Uncharacterized protein n=1 Tax=Neorhizobium alkalisoli TaxID=528178 RepID=A0A561Q7I4_9HYPH|nr:hypothetical protein [Neorhizobium alkalisoli]TWF46309.1 hypothetical protein FHW37_1154 [Neorhizobium alkalisoli]
MTQMSFTALISHPHAYSDQFTLLELTNEDGSKTPHSALENGPVFADKDALQVALAGELALDYQSVDVNLKKRTRDFSRDVH